MNDFTESLMRTRVESRPPRSTCENCQSTDSTPQSTDIEFDPHCKYLRADSMRPLTPKFIPAEIPSSVPGGQSIETSNRRNRWLLDKDTSGIANPPRAHDGGVVTVKVKGNANTVGYIWELSDKAEFVKVDANGKVTGQYLDMVPGSPTKYTGKGTMHVRALGAPGTVTVKAEKDGKTGTTQVEIVCITFEKCTQGARCSQAANFPIYGFDDCDPQPPITRPPVNWNVGPNRTTAITPANPAPPAPPLSAYEHLLYPHISVETNKPTHVHVKIEGNVAAATDFIFKTDATGVCEVLNASNPVLVPDTQTGPRRAPVTNVILQLKAKRVTPQNNKTLLRVLCHGINNNDRNHTCKNDEFAKLGVHVYLRKEVQVIVAKVFDSSKPGTTVSTCASTDFDNTTNSSLNNKVKILNEAVVTYNMENYTNASPSNGVVVQTPGLVDIKNHPDASTMFDSNGFFLYYHGTLDGGPALAKLVSILGASNVSKKYVAIVNKLKSIYVLKLPANAGSLTITVTAPMAKENSELTLSGLGPPIPALDATTGRPVLDASGAPTYTTPTNTEPVKTTTVTRNASGATITLKTPLRHPYQAGAILEFSAAGWSSEPIIMTESGTVDDIMRIVMHEVGHTHLKLFDVNDVDVGGNITSRDAEAMMHFQAGTKDNLLRYCPRPRHYNPDVDPNSEWDAFKKEENQWEMIPR